MDFKNDSYGAEENGESPSISGTSQTSSGSVSWELVTQAESQAPSQTQGTRICNLTRSPSDLYAYQNLRSLGVKVWFSILPVLQNHLGNFQSMVNWDPSLEILIHTF